MRQETTFRNSPTSDFWRNGFANTYLFNNGFNICGFLYFYCPVSKERKARQDIHNTNGKHIPPYFFYEVHCKRAHTHRTWPKLQARQTRKYRTLDRTTRHSFIFFLEEGDEPISPILENLYALTNTNHQKTKTLN